MHLFIFLLIGIFNFVVDIVISFSVWESFYSFFFVLKQLSVEIYCIVIYNYYWFRIKTSIEKTREKEILKIKDK